jgi:DNA-binding beta-propeller fold protein YncE
LRFSRRACPQPRQRSSSLNKSEHTASLIDPDSGKTLAKLPVGRGPHEVIVSPDGRTAFVSNFGPYGICPAGDTMCKTPGNTITVLDLAERKVRRHTTTGTNKGQHGSVISRDGKHVWVTSETPKSLLEIDAATGKIVHQWPDEAGAQPPRRRDAG